MRGGVLRPGGADGSSDPERPDPSVRAGAADGSEPGETIGAEDDDRGRPAQLPAGRAVELPGRGRTWVHEATGPDGAGPGEVPTLLLLHGWTATAGLNWFTSFPALTKRFHVVALDHRGHGRGIRSPRRFRLEDCADDAVALADELGIDQFIPVGYSMGGPIAQLVWRRHPDRVQGLVLCATSRNFRGSPIELALFSAMGGLSLAARMTPSQWQRQLGARFAQRRYDDSDIGHWARTEITRGNPRMVVEAGRAIGRFSSHDWISEVDVPTAVVVTERDTVVPPDRQRKLAEAIPDARVVGVQGDHAVCVMGPQAFIPALVHASSDVVRRATWDGLAAG